MAQIAVIHNDLNVFGGGESVCMHTIELLQRQGHDVTLFTASNPPIADLNEYYKTSVDFKKLQINAYPLIGSIPDIAGKFGLVQITILNRILKKEIDTFDLVISTSAPIAVEAPSLHYVHCPRFDQSTINESLVTNIALSSIAKIAGHDRDLLANDLVIANSQWTKNQFEASASTSAEVVYPPVDTSGLGDVEWDEMENGFVTIGRIAPSKRLLRSIEIIDGVRDRGHDVHLHIIGPDGPQKYINKVQEAAASRNYVQIDGKLSREELVDQINRHKYGIHGRQNEHFGIAVAELVIGKSKTFVPDSGGQTEIVQDERYAYSSVSDAVDRISAEIPGDPPNEVEHSFSKPRFMDEMASKVRRALDK